MNVTVVGGGVSGLGYGVGAGPRGHQVTVVERDHTPMPTSADEAFEWDRRGAPQVRHSHAFLARLRNLLLNDYPDVYADLFAEGATEMPFGGDLPPEMTNYEPEPADDELAMLACRRTTFEWVVRRAAVAEGRVEFRTGVAVKAVIADAGSSTARVTGVVSATAPNWPAISSSSPPAAGALRRIGWKPSARRRIPKRSRTRASSTSAASTASARATTTRHAAVPIGGDLGYLKYGVFVGDNRTF